MLGSNFGGVVPGVSAVLVVRVLTDLLLEEATIFVISLSATLTRITNYNSIISRRLNDGHE